MRGGKRDGAGRPKGAVSRWTSEMAAACLEGGISPLEYLLNMMRNPKAPADLRFEAAKVAAPYCHPRLSIQTIEAAGEPTYEERLLMLHNSYQDDLSSGKNQAPPADNLL